MSDVLQPSGNTVSDPTSPTNATVRLEPITENIIVPVPWYKRFFGGQVVQTQTVWRLSVVAILIVGIFIGQYLQKPTQTKTQAAAGKARVSIYPLESKVPPEKSFQLWMTSDQNVASADIVVSFDPNAIQLTREVSAQSIPGSDVTFTTWTQANVSGEITFHVQPGARKDLIKAGTNQLSTFYFKVTQGSPLISSTIMINEEKSTVVGQGMVPMLLTTTNASVGLK